MRRPIVLVTKIQTSPKYVKHSHKNQVKNS